MAKGSGKRILVTLGCTQCRERNYHTNKNKESDSQRLELKKFCPRCRSHTLHREVR